MPARFLPEAGSRKQREAGSGSEIHINMESTELAELPSAFGGSGWRPRAAGLRDEIGTLWGACGQDSEWMPLRRVLLHRPGGELGQGDPSDLLMLELPDPELAGAQHEAMAAIYAAEGIEVDYVEPALSPPPNLIFTADLFFMTPQGAIVGRPAGAARAGEERWVARRLADLGIPILRTVSGRGVFEGADAMWLDPGTVLLGRGLRTNTEGAEQVGATLREQGIEAITLDLPFGALHLMGQLRILDRDLAFVVPERIPFLAVELLEARGYSVHFFPDDVECAGLQSNNIVTLGPRRILMPVGCPNTRASYERAGVTCLEVDTREIGKAAGGIACATGVLERAPAAPREGVGR
jgi:arginine deiminase